METVLFTIKKCNTKNIATKLIGHKIFFLIRGFDVNIFYLQQKNTYMSGNKFH